MKGSERSLVGRLLSFRPERRHRATEPNLGQPESEPRVTVFDDRALRFRSLTVEPVDLAQNDPADDAEAFKIRLARTDKHRERAGDLVERRYAWRGYGAHRVKADPHLYTFVAFDAGEPVGTVSVRLDSAAGLSADGLYKTELDALRDRGHSLCEFTRLAVDTQAGSKYVLGSLFHTVWMFAYQVCGRTHGVIEVNPRHAAFYRRSVLFRPIGEERMKDGVNAPAVLLLWQHSLIPPQLEKYAGRPDLASTTRVMFPHWFSAKDAAGILRRLRELYDARC